MYRIIMITLTAVIVALYLIRFSGKPVLPETASELRAALRSGWLFEAGEQTGGARSDSSLSIFHYMKLNIFLMRKDEQEDG